MKRILVVILSASIFASMMQAMTLKQAKDLYKAGRFADALPAMEEFYKKTPKNASYNQWYGACLYETGKKAESEKYFKYALDKKVADAARYLAQLSLERMDYAAFSLYLEQFTEMIDGEEDALSETASKGLSHLMRVEEMLNRVEKIEIFDSITVSKNNFFSFYRLSAEAGKVENISIGNDSIVVYEPQSGNRRLMALPDSLGIDKIMESNRFPDGKWDTPTPLDIATDGSQLFPFLMSDGMTLYFSDNGSKSIGGYDIMMSRKDLSNGEYYEPQNVGMPYNSPFNDYLLAIDEMTGIGWWATDRNAPQADVVTIYIFKTNNIRENYDRTETDVYGFAAVTSIGATQNVDSNYDSLRDAIKAIEEVSEVRDFEFTFVIKNGVVYHYFDDFRSSEAKGLMHKRIALSADIDELKADLSNQREQYASASNAARNRMTSTILTSERNLENKIEELARVDNHIRAIEQRLIK
ncbi:MAG: tetratricopeptide repeat protein [Candidatus Limisoma sp.]|nr:tetratricopeptide repeat protein [Candidatus Limisoma sp.]